MHAFGSFDWEFREVLWGGNINYFNFPCTGAECAEWYQFADSVTAGLASANYIDHESANLAELADWSTESAD